MADWLRKYVPALLGFGSVVAAWFALRLLFPDLLGEHRILFWHKAALAVVGGFWLAIWLVWLWLISRR